MRRAPRLQMRRRRLGGRVMSARHGRTDDDARRTHPPAASGRGVVQVALNGRRVVAADAVVHLPAEQPLREVSVFEHGQLQGGAAEAGVVVGVQRPPHALDHHQVCAHRRLGHFGRHAAQIQAGRAMPAAHDVQPGKGGREEAKGLGMLDDQRETVLTMWRGSQDQSPTVSSVPSFSTKRGPSEQLRKSTSTRPSPTADPSTGKGMTPQTCPCAPQLWGSPAGPQNPWREAAAGAG